MSTTVHENPDVFGETPREFNGFQWAEIGKEAVMTGPAHIVFGLGRFACPGRVLAVNGAWSPDQVLRCVSRNLLAPIVRRPLSSTSVWS